MWVLTKSQKKSMVNWILLLFCLPLIALALIIASKNISQDAFLSQVMKAIENKEISADNYKEIPQGFVDNWSNCSSVIQSTTGFPKNVLKSSIVGVYLGECPTLIRLMSQEWNGTGFITQSFPQYWHGYQTILKPLIVLFGFDYTTVLLTLLSMFALVALLRELNLNLIQKAVVLWTILLLSDFMLLHQSIPQAIWQLSALMIPTLMLHSQKNVREHENKMLLIAFSSGFASWYFDFGFAVGVSLIIWYQAISRIKENPHTQIKMLGIWICGLFYSIFAHTILVSFYDGPINAFRHILDRFNDDTVANVNVSYLDGLRTTFRFTQSTEFLEIWLIGIVILFILIRPKMFAQQISRIMQRVVISIGIVLSYLISTSSVSSYHAWLAQRIWPWLFAFVLAEMIDDFEFRLNFKGFWRKI